MFIGVGQSPHLMGMVRQKADFSEVEVLGVPFLCAGEERWVWPSKDNKPGEIYHAVQSVVMGEQKVVHSVPYRLAVRMRLQCKGHLKEAMTSGEVLHQRNTDAGSLFNKLIQGDTSWSPVVAEEQPLIEWVDDSGFTEEEAVRAYWYLEHGLVQEFQSAEGFRAWVAAYAENQYALLLTNIPYVLRSSPKEYCALTQAVMDFYDTNSLLLGSAGTSKGSYSRRQKVFCLSSYVSYATIKPLK